MPPATKSDDTDVDDINKGDGNNGDDMDADESVLGDEGYRSVVDEDYEIDETCGGSDVSDDADAWPLDQHDNCDARTAAHKYAEVLRAEAARVGGIRTRKAPFNPMRFARFLLQAL